MAGYTDGQGIVAKFNAPHGVTVDGLGNVYVADDYNNRIRKITATGTVSTLAGSGVTGYADGQGTAAQFNLPYGITVDGAGNLYVADNYNNRIRKITAAGTVSTIAGNGTAGYSEGLGSAAQFNQPYGVTVDGAGNLYVADTGNHCIRKITAAGAVSTVAGNGTAGYSEGLGAAARFSSPRGIAADGAGNLFVADTSNHCIRKITAAGTVTTIAGNGTAGYSEGLGTAARFSSPRGIAADGAGNLFIADSSNHCIREITSAGLVSTVAGNGTSGYADGPGPVAQFNLPFSVAVDGAGNLYAADDSNYRIRKISF